MPCINLKGEMAKNGITIEAIAKLLGIHRNSAANKINGDSSFTPSEKFLRTLQHFAAENSTGM